VVSENLINRVELLTISRILVIGDIILDRYVWGECTRISPEAPIQILNVRSQEARLGGAANVARNLATLSANNKWISCGGVVGSDDEGKIVFSLLKKANVSTENVVFDKTRQTTTKTRMISHNQQILRIDNEKNSPISRDIEHRLVKRVNDILYKYDAIVFSDYSKGTLTESLCKNLIAKAKKLGKFVIAGPKGKDFTKYEGADGIVLNHSELISISGISPIENASAKIIKLLSLKFLVVTLGENGLALYKSDGTSLYLPTAARDVYDVTGAGDTVLATFALFYIAKVPLEDCAKLANIAAGIVVGKIGTAVATRQEILSALRGIGYRTDGKIVDINTLRRILSSERKSKKIVFTNGCFDILHVGHISTLQFAKGLGDILVVGINSDKSVRSIKLSPRPIVPQDERAKILAALALVDFVVLFDEQTPLNIIKKIKPDILVKGADWKGREVVGQNFVESYGGSVKLSPIVPGVSTSNIINKISKIAKSN